MRNPGFSLAIPLVIALSVVSCGGPPGPAGQNEVVVGETAGQNEVVVGETAGQNEVVVKAAGQYQVVAGETAVDTVPVKQLRVACPVGKKAFGAGWSVLDETGAILDGQATYFQPASDGSYWLVNAAYIGLKWKLRVQVICATVS